jgi:hypothetical protein
MLVRSQAAVIFSLISPLNSNQNESSPNQGPTVTRQEAIDTKNRIEQRRKSLPKSRNLNETQGPVLRQSHFFQSNSAKVSPSQSFEDKSENLTGSTFSDNESLRKDAETAEIVRNRQHNRRPSHHSVETKGAVLRQFDGNTTQNEEKKLQTTDQPAQKKKGFSFCICQ